MAKGAVAKEKVEKKIAEAFGADFIGNFDKKIYVWANDGGERVQIAISLTCPKTPVATSGSTAIGDYDFAESITLTEKDLETAIPVEKVEISEEEKNNLADLLAKFGL